MQSSGQTLLVQAGQAREEGRHLEALKLHDEAMLVFQKDGDLSGLTQTLADRSIVFRHLAEEVDDKNWLLLARAEMEASVEIARTADDKTALAIPLYNLAKVFEALGNYSQAVTTYKEATENMESNPPTSHNRPSVLSDMKIHLNYAEYKSGDKSALERMLENTKDLENSKEAEISKYNYDVWVTGAYMSLAEMLREDDKDQAKTHLQKAKEIIDSNPELTIRKQQWEKLSQIFS